MVKSEHLALLVYVLASTAGVVLIKRFLNTLDSRGAQDIIIHLGSPQLLAGVSLYVFGFLTWLYVLSRMDLNIAYPVAITLSFIAILLASSLFLQESFTINIVIGMALCLTGIVIILR